MNFYKMERERRDMTQEDIAFAAGISPTTVSRLENGVHKYNHKLDLWLVETADDPVALAKKLREGYEEN